MAESSESSPETRPRRNGVKYSSSFTSSPGPAHTRKTMLTPKRKEMILEFRGKDMENVGTLLWKRRLQSFISTLDMAVSPEDVERWISVHEWIVSEDRADGPTPVKPRNLVRRRATLAPSTSRRTKTIAAASTKATTTAAAVPATAV